MKTTVRLVMDELILAVIEECGDLQYKQLEAIKDDLEVAYISRLYRICGYNWSRTCQAAGMDADVLKKPSKMSNRMERIHHLVLATRPSKE